MIDRDKFLQKIVRFSAVILLIAAAALVAWSFISRIDFIQQWYDQYYAWLGGLEERIVAIEDKQVIAIVIELLFLIKCIVPIVPLSVIFIITGAVFPFHTALLLDFAGVTMLMAVKYWLGYRKGKNNMQKLLARYETTRKVLEHNGISNPWLLVVFRLVPCFPINQISKFYGAKKYSFKKYMLFSLLGYSPRLIAYNYVGTNVFNPFSIGFLSPLIVIFTVSGVSMLAVNEILEYTMKKNRSGKR